MRHFIKAALLALLAQPAVAATDCERMLTSLLEAGAALDAGGKPIATSEPKLIDAATRASEGAPSAAPEFESNALMCKAFETYLEANARFLQLAGRKIAIAQTIHSNCPPELSISGGKEVDATNARLRDRIARIETMRALSDHCKGLAK